MLLVGAGSHILLSGQPAYRAAVVQRVRPTACSLSTLHAVAFKTGTELCRLYAGCRFLESQPTEERGLLWGVPFAVKDNIDVAGYPTTCACPDFAYTPGAHAPTVQALVDAGAGGKLMGAGFFLEEPG